MFRQLINEMLCTSPEGRPTADDLFNRPAIQVCTGGCVVVDHFALFPAF